jgi:cholesterol transport system auxiliary component
MSRRVVTVCVAASAALALGGCVSLWPKTPPVQLYELSPEVEAAPTAGSGRPAVDIRLESVRFQQAAAGDRILTVHDDQAAYIGGARWVSPAETLFEEGLGRAFAQHARGVRLVPHSAAAGISYALSVDVDTFQVRMVGGTPTVETALRARLIRFPEGKIVLDQRIDVTRKADADRVASIVRAYDVALGAALTTLVESTDEVAGNRAG